MSVCYSFVSVRDKKLKSVHIMGVTMDTTNGVGGTTMGTMEALLWVLWSYRHYGTIVIELAKVMWTCTIFSS